MQKLKLARDVAVKDFHSGGWNGVQLPIWSPNHPLNWNSAFGGTGISGDRERIENDFESYVYGAYKSSGPVFSCITARQFVFSEAEFVFKAKQDGKLFGSTALELLENPWPGGTTGELLAHMEQDASLAGNSWWTVTNDQGDYGNAAKKRGTGQRIARLRPDWVTMLIGTKRKDGDVNDIDATLLGILYRPMATTGGPAGESVILTAEEVAHYSPIPDPIARFRGMSWLTPILREIEGDKSATVHKASFYENAAVPNMVIKFHEDTNLDDIEEFKEKFSGSHQGKWRAYKTLFLMGGADATPLTHDFRQLDFTNVVGKGENRIANAAGVPASWVGFSEGLQGSALNAGNMGANRRRFADGTIRQLWRIACASLAPLVDVPAGATLWWKEDGIAFLREDQTDRAEIMRVDMNSIDAGIKAGFEPDACVEAVFTNDIRKLIGAHTGLVSVQMQPPVDPDNTLEETQGQARILTTQAQTIQSFVAAGFTHESAVAATDKNDLTLLKKDTTIEPWSPTGQPLRQPGSADGTKPPAGTTPPTGGKPPAPAKPSTTPGGGSNGQ